MMTVAGDSTSLEKSFSRVGKSAKEMADDLDTAAGEAKVFGKNMDRAGQAADGSTTHFRGAADVTDGLGTVLETVGINGAGALGTVATLGMGFADMADGLATTLIPALKTGLGGALKFIQTHPVLLTLGLLAAAFVLLWQNSETFRTVVTGVFQGVQRVVGDVIGWILDGVDKFLGGLAAIVNAGSSLPLVGGKFKGVAESIRGAQDDVRGLADGMHRLGETSLATAQKMQTVNIGGFKIPGVVVSGKRAAGGPVSGGSSYLVGERGPELFTPSAAGMVTPNHALGGGGMTVNVVVQGTVTSERKLIDAVVSGINRSQRNGGAALRSV